MFGQHAKIRLPAQVRRYYEGPFWDTWHFRPRQDYTEAMLKMFTVPFGQVGEGTLTNGRAATETDTNMDESGRVSAGLAFTVTAVTWDIWAASQIDLDNLVREGSLYYKFLNTEVPIAPLSTFRPALGFNMDRVLKMNSEERKALGDPERVFEGLSKQTTDTIKKLYEARQHYLNSAPGMYRGGLQYTELPDLLSANTTFCVPLKIGEYKPQGPSWIRVALHGVVTSAVPSSY